MRVSPSLSAPGAGLLQGMLFCSFCALLTGTAIAPVFAHGVFDHHLCAAHQSSPCSSFTHGVFAPFMHGSSGRPLLRFRSWDICCYCALACWDSHFSRFAHGGFALFRVRLAGTGIAAVLLIGCLPLSCTGSPGRPLFLFCSRHVCPLSCAARRDGHCSGFAHGVFAAIVR